MCIFQVVFWISRNLGILRIVKIWALLGKLCKKKILQFRKWIKTTLLTVARVYFTNVKVKTALKHEIFAAFYFPGFAVNIQKSRN